MKAYNVKNLLKTDPRDIPLDSQFDLESGIETLGELYRACEDDSIDLETKNRIIAKCNVLQDRVDDAKQKDNIKARALFDGNSTGGRVMDKEGRIKAFKPSEKVSDGKGDMSLGQFLRAAVDRPRNSVERTAIQNATGSDGIELPSFVSNELIDRLRDENAVINAGGRTLTIDGLDGTSFVRITGDPTAVWHAELTDETPTDPTMDAVSLIPKTILALTEVSREVLADSSNIEEALEATFVGSINQAILSATFGGATANGPTGLGSIVTQEEEFANGGSPAYSNFVNANKVLFDNNVPQDTRSHLMAPDVWQSLNNAEDTTGQPKRRPFGLSETPEFVSSGVPAKTAYAGSFENVVYGFRLNITLEQFPGAGATKYASLWMAAARLDMAVFRPSAFVRIQEASA